jgi:hypothetical protein
MRKSKKVKIQIEDNEGSKYSITLEGNVNKEKVMKIVELMQLIDNDYEEEQVNLNSTGDKIWHLIEEYYPFNDFTSSKLLEAYEDTYNESIKLSVISTYLSRFSRRGLLSRIRGKNEWIYKKSIVKQPQFG